MESQKTEGLITYPMDEQIVKFKDNSGTNQEFWGVYVDFKSNQNKWTVHGILKHRGFYPPTENSNVMVRENLKTTSCECIIIYQDDLYTVSTTAEQILHISQDKYKINMYLESNYRHDPDGTNICQHKEYLEELYANDNMLFKDKLPRDLLIAFKIIKLLIKKGNQNLIHNKNTYQHLHYLSRKRKLQKLYNEVISSIFLTHHN